MTVWQFSSFLLVNVSFEDTTFGAAFGTQHQTSETRVSGFQGLKGWGVFTSSSKLFIKKPRKSCGHENGHFHVMSYQHHWINDKTIYNPLLLFQRVVSCMSSPRKNPSQTPLFLWTTSRRKWKAESLHQHGQPWLGQIAEVEEPGRSAMLGWLFMYPKWTSGFPHNSPTEQERAISYVHSCIVYKSMLVFPTKISQPGAFTLFLGATLNSHDSTAGSWVQWLVTGLQATCSLGLWGLLADLQTKFTKFQHIPVEKGTLFKAFQVRIFLVNSLPNPRWLNKISGLARRKTCYRSISWNQTNPKWNIAPIIVTVRMNQKTMIQEVWQLFETAWVSVFQICLQYVFFPKL